MNYVAIFFITVTISALLTGGIKYLAQRLNIVDDPRCAPQRKKHLQPIPLLGGVAFYLTLVVMVSWLAPHLTQGYLLTKHLIGIGIAGFIIIIGGVLDDRFSLSPSRQIFFPVLASGVIVLSGIGPTYITNPFGGVISLTQWQWTLFTWHNLPYQLTLLADSFTIGWLLVSMYTTKLLDGLDGLVPGVTVIGGLIIFFLSLSEKVQQPETATLALVLAGAAAGFLVWNFYPAKIYLGEAGALFTGFMLGVLAILSGGKIATALLILGLPLIDIAWVVIRRVWIAHKSPFAGDTLHLHLQLRTLGLSERSIVLLFYTITLAFGLSTLFFSSIVKLFILMILATLTIMLLSWTYHKARHNS